VRIVPTEIHDAIIRAAKELHPDLLDECRDEAAKFLRKEAETIQEYEATAAP